MKLGLEFDIHFRSNVVIFFVRCTDILYYRGKKITYRYLGSLRLKEVEPLPEPLKKYKPSYRVHNKDVHD